MPALKSNNIYIGILSLNFMKLEVNVNKKYFFSFIIIGLVIIGVVGVIAYNSSPGNPAVFGHSVNEIDWSQSINQLCLNDVCISSWENISGDSSGGAGASQWTTFGNNIYYSGGNVGIGISSPVARLDVNGAARIRGEIVSEGGLIASGSATILGDLSANNVALNGNLSVSGIVNKIPVIYYVLTQEHRDYVRDSAYCRFANTPYVYGNDMAVGTPVATGTVLTITESNSNGGIVLRDKTVSDGLVQWGSPDAYSCHPDSNTCNNGDSNDYCNGRTAKVWRARTGYLLI